MGVVALLTRPGRRAYLPWAAPAPERSAGTAGARLWRWAVCAATTRQTTRLAVESFEAVRVPGSDHDAILVDLVW